MGFKKIRKFLRRIEWNIKRMFRISFLIKASIVLIIVIIVIFFYFHKKPSDILLSFSAQSSLVVSAETVRQGDTLLVVVKNEPREITGTLDSAPLLFFRNQNGKDWVGIAGIPVDKNPSNYTLTISLANKETGALSWFNAPIFKKDITVEKSNFSVMPLTIPPALVEKGYTPKSIINTIVNKENVELKTVLNVVTPESYISKPFTNPLSKIEITGEFGTLRNSKQYNIQHLGVDLKASANTPVKAANDGKVVFTKKLPDYGNVLILDHGLGVYSLYLHLNQFKAKKGTMVKQGDVVALSGNTGYTTGPHLHFSVKVRGVSVDPLSFIKATQNEW